MAKNRNLLPGFTGMTRPFSESDETSMINNATFTDFYKRLRLLALSVYEWEGLPESCNAEFLEKTLYLYGLAVFVDDPALGIINLKCTPSNSLNIYDIATEYNCYSIGYNKIFPLDDIVLVRNNIDRLPTDTTIQLFARRLYEAERACDVNVKGQKTPVLVACDESQKLTLKNVYSQYDGNMPVIYSGKNFDSGSIKTFPTVAPFVADKLQQYKRNVWTECLTFLGVNNVETEKKERLTTDEVNANNNIIDLSAETMLFTRQRAAEEFNKKWGANVSVRRRSFRELVEDFGDPEAEEGSDNGEVYN